MAQDRNRMTVSERQTTVQTAPRRAVVETEVVNRRVEDRIQDVEIPSSFNLRHDRVRWGPIVAGLLSALSTLLTLNLLGLALGLTRVNAATAAAQGQVPDGLGATAGIWAAVSTLIAFALGGWVASRAAAIFDRGWGAVNGLMVFFLAVPLLLLLAGQGLGAILGGIGGLANSLAANPQASQTAQQQAPQVAGQAQQAAQQAQQAVQANATQIGDIAARARDASWGALLGLGAGVIASALGGYLGVRREVEVDRATGSAHEH